MTQHPKTARQLRAEYAAARRHHPDQDHSELKNQLDAATAEATIVRILNTTPHFTNQQQRRIVHALYQHQRSQP